MLLKAGYFWDGAARNDDRAGEMLMLAEPPERGCGHGPRCSESPPQLWQGVSREGSITSTASVPSLAFWATWALFMLRAWETHLWMILIFLSTTLLKGSLSTLPVGIQVGVATMESRAEVPRARYVTSVLSDSMTLQTRRLCPWDSPGKNTGVRCHALLPDPGIKPASPMTPTLQVDSLTLSHQGSHHRGSLKD